MDEINSKTQQENFKELSEMIAASKRIVAFTGAGVSTESDIPDFRSARGVYESIQKQYGLPAETLLSHSFFSAHPEIFFDYLRRYLVFPDAQPNDAHKSLAALERKGIVSGVVTQNIDGLHTKAGSSNLCELHGSIHRNFCVHCKKRYPLDFVLSSSTIPRCTDCGGIVRPDVVLYEEPLDGVVMEKAAAEITRADMLLIMGTSLAVYPAAGFIEYFRGDNIVIVNKDETPYDRRAKLCINALAGQTLRSALEMLNIDL